MATSDTTQTPRRRRPTERSRQAEVNKESLVIAARDLFAESGPGAVSIRAVAERAGCSHTLVGRHFGSKAGLEAAVIDRLAVGVSALVTHMCSVDGWPTSIIVRAFRDHPSAARLVVRCALGEFDATPLVKGHNIALCLAETIEERRGGDPKHPSPTARAGAFFAFNTLMGYFTLEDLVVNGCRVTDVPTPVRDAAIADAADLIVAHASDPAVDLAWAPGPHTTRRPVTIDTSDMTAKEALLLAAIELYAERGPGSVTTRDIADRADVNQGLIYHYFESREDLFAKAVELANTPLVESGVRAGRLDLERIIRERPDLSSLTIIARHLVDGGRILDIRRRFPVMDAVLAQYATVPSGEGPGGLADPRLAALATSSYYAANAVWDELVRKMLKIPVSADLEEAGGRIIALLLEQPTR